jgi:hypothetical protein
MDEYGHLNGNMQSGDTGYYKDFPVVYNYESGKGYTFSVQYSINGYQTGDGTQPFTKDFTCGRSKQVGSTLKQVKDFIETRTDPAKAIVPAGTSQYVPSTEDMDRVNEGQDSWLDRIYADASNYCGFQYSVYTMGFDAESHVYYQQNGVEKEEFYSSDAFGDTYAIVEAHAQNFILDNALIKPPIVTAK